MNNPFDYDPHPLCRSAAERVKAYVESQPLLLADAQRGKMFGVLIVEKTEGVVAFAAGTSSASVASGADLSSASVASHSLNGRQYFLAAYSGLLAGRNDWPFFVSPVFDAQQPEGHFKQTERLISSLNAEIAALDSFPPSAFPPFPPVPVGRHSWRQSLLQYRKALSEALQLWLFRQYRMLNGRGERKDLVDIWRDYHSSPKLLGKFPLPPGGTGDCCAPKLLQYAYEHHLRPLYIAEFWYGQSPRGEVRHHGHFYPACRGKCLPVLSFMLQGLEVEEGVAEAARNRRLENELQILYSDSQLLVVVKPSGLLSVPGRIAAPSLQELLSEKYGQVFMPHRLDMDTSGLMVVALTADAYRHLQQQFYARTIYKRYTALLDGPLPVGQCGTIDLPLRPDPLDRPRQVVDRLHGKQAVTDYEVLPLPAGFAALNDEAPVALVSLKPHTGRTHQLRLHCAHHDGLGLPIVGDCLYGKRPFHRLCLHAAELAFTHPLTNERLHFCTEPKFLS